jgi:hypothetical protein
MNLAMHFTVQEVNTTYRSLSGTSVFWILWSCSSQILETGVMKKKLELFCSP